MLGTKLYTSKCSGIMRREISSLKHLLILLAAGLGLVATSAHAEQPIPDAPQDFLYRYLQSLNLTSEDVNVLDGFALTYLTKDFLDARNNEVKATLLRQKALALIKSYVPSSRVLLGMKLILGDYDLQKQRFRLLYPVFGTDVTNSSSNTIAFQARDGEANRSQPTRVSDCTTEASATSFATPGYLQVFGGCIQNDVQGFYGYVDSILANKARVLPKLFKLIPEFYPEWNYLNMAPEQASSLIDATAYEKRRIWAYMVFDVDRMILPPDPAVGPAEGGNSRIKTIGAAFEVKPIAIFAWKFPFKSKSRPIQSSDFIFSKGDVTTPLPPEDLISEDLVKGGPTSPTTATPSAKPESRAACPAGLPADAALDKCADQASLFSAGLYMDASGHIHHLGAAAASKAAQKDHITSSAPLSPAEGSSPPAPPIVDFGSPERADINSTEEEHNTKPVNTNKPEPPAGSKSQVLSGARVTVQYSAGSDSAAAQADAVVKAVAASTPRVASKPLPAMVLNSCVVYYHAEDRAGAVYLTQLIQRMVGSKWRTVWRGNLSALPSPGSIEVWMP